MTTPHPDRRKLFHFSLSLRDGNAALEEESLRALGELSQAVDGILLCVPSYYEAPDAPRHPLVQRVVQMCGILGLDVYWGRRLWVTWHNHTGYAQQAGDVFTPAYYAAYLSRLYLEAQMLGAVGTTTYGEPHGESIYCKGFKRTGFTTGESEHVEAAIEEAVCYAPRTTLVYPVSWSSKMHFGRAFRPLGEQNLHHQTYRVADTTQLPGTPSTALVQLHWFGTWITTQPSADPPGKRPLTVEEWLALDMGVAEAQYPELNDGGLWIYTASAERAAVMRGLGAAAREG